jgi:hypothetical protein
LRVAAEAHPLSRQVTCARAAFAPVKLILSLRNDDDEVELVAYNVVEQLGQCRAGWLHVTTMGDEGCTHGVFIRCPGILGHLIHPWGVY